MLVISTGKQAGAFALALTASIFLFAGCNHTAPPPPGPPGGGNLSVPPGSTKTAAAKGGSGAELLPANCRCHGGGKAPDLSHIGSDPTHTAGWIAEYANNPKSKKADSKMPAMAGKVSSEDMQKIATYLASQK